MYFCLLFILPFCKEINYIFFTQCTVDEPLPPKKEAVFVLGLCQQENDILEFDLVGTGFAVSPHRLLSAYHCLFDEDVGNTAAQLTSALHGSSCYVGSTATRLPLSDKTDPSFSFSLQGTIKVTLVGGSFTEDWLVLNCEDVLPIYFTICPSASLPNVDKTSVSIRVVHCPVGKFVADKAMKVLRAQVLHTSITEMSENVIETPNGLVTGSSGGVYINNTGYAVAIHLESTDEMKSRTTSGDSVPAVGAVSTAAVGATTRSVKFDVEMKAQRVEIDRLQTAVARNKRYIKMLSKKHMSFGRGLIICNTDDLIAAILEE